MPEENLGPVSAQSLQPLLKKKSVEGFGFCFIYTVYRFQWAKMLAKRFIFYFSVGKLWSICISKYDYLELGSSRQFLGE